MKNSKKVVVFMFLAIIVTLLFGCSGGNKTYSLTITADNGIVWPNPDLETYEEGTEVTLTAEANEGYIFDHWEGNLSGSNNPETVVVNDNLTIEAIFVEDIANYTVTITVENGTVTKDPNLELYPEGTEVTLTATPNEGYEFSGWTGDVTSTENPLTISVYSDKQLTANFALADSWTYIETGLTGISPDKLTVAPNGDFYLTYADADDYAYVLKVPAGSTVAENLGQVCGGYFGNTALTVDSLGQPIVLGYDVTFAQNVVKKWNGTNWVDLNLAGSVTGPTSAAVYMDIATDEQDNIYIALGERIGYDDLVVIYKYDNATTTWSQIEFPFFDLLESAGPMSILCDSIGNLYVGYALENRSDEPAIAKWDGTSWTDVGTVPFMTGNLGRPELTIDASDQLYACISNGYSETHKIFAYDGTSLTELAAQPSTTVDTDTVRFYIDSMDNKYAVRIDSLMYPDPDEVYVEQWDGTSWNEVFAFSDTEENPVSTCNLLYAANGTFYHASNLSVWNGEKYVPTLKLRVSAF